MSKVQDTAKSINADKALRVRVLPNMSPDAAMAIAENLRNLATTNHEQFVVQGRKAMLALMAEVYLLYNDAKVSSDKGETFMGKVKAKLAELKVEVRKSSPESSQLIRYICKDFDDKQVSIYGRSLAVAFKTGIPPAGFVAFIDGTKGGFAGVRDAEPPAETDSKVKIGEDIAVTHARAEKTVTTFEVTDWEEDEEYRVLIAIRNVDDDTASVKNARLSVESLKAVLARYEADKKERNKPTKDQDAEMNKLALQVIEGDAANAKVNVGNLEAELNDAIANGHAAKCDGLRVRLKVAQMQAKATEKTYKAFKVSLKSPVAE